jgi:hypothetical protein
VAQRTIDAAAIEAEVDQIRSLGIDALRTRHDLFQSLDHRTSDYRYEMERSALLRAPCN